MRHLTRSFAVGALNRGKQIEQFLGGFTRDDQHIIRWAALSPGKNDVTLYLSEVIDVGTDTFMDVSEFPPADPDDETWGKIIGTVASSEEALDLAERELAAPDRWVNHGVVGSEYADYRAAKRANPEHPRDLDSVHVDQTPVGCGLTGRTSLMVNRRPGAW